MWFSRKIIFRIYHDFFQLSWQYSLGGEIRRYIFHVAANLNQFQDKFSEKKDEEKDNKLSPAI